MRAPLQGHLRRYRRVDRRGVWPFITNFHGYVAMAVGMEVIGALGSTAYGAYTIDVLPPDE